MAAAVHTALLLRPGDVGVDLGPDRVCRILQLRTQCGGISATQTHAASATPVHIQVEAIGSNSCEHH